MACRELRQKSLAFPRVLQYKMFSSPGWLLNRSFPEIKRSRYKAIARTDNYPTVIEIVANEVASERLIEQLFHIILFIHTHSSRKASEREKVNFKQ